MDKNPVKVLHIASGDLWAGAEVQLFTLAKSLTDNTETKVNVILLNHGRLEQKLLDNNINVAVIDESTFNGFQVLIQIIRTIKIIQPDVIHTHRTKENILGSIAALLTGNIPTLRTAHGAPEHYPAWHNIVKHFIRYLDWFCGQFLQKKIIAVSDDLAEILKKDFPAEKIKVIENGIDTASLIDSVKSKKSDTESSDAPFKIGIAGRLTPVKRVDLFIQAAAELLSERPELNISFHIFGDGPLRSDLNALNQKLATGNMVHFEGHCENMHEKLIDLDTLVLTSDHEGLPMILLEAMVLQTPVIAHAVGGIPNLLDHGTCGVLVSDHRPSAYAEEIYQLINNPETCKSLINNALNRAKTFYSSKQNANAYFSTYKKLCRNKSLSSRN